MAIIILVQHKPNNHELDTISLHLFSALNGVKICRQSFDKGRRTDAEQIITVPMTWDTKTRQFAESLQVNGQYKVPIIAIGMTGVTHDPTRSVSRNNDVIMNSWSGRDGFDCYCKPTPVNVTYRLSARSNKADDISQIIAHYVKAFNPEISFSWMNPLWPEELEAKVTWDGSFSMDYATEVSADEERSYQTSTSFTVKAWIFGERKDNILPLQKVDFNLGTINPDDCNCSIDGDYSLLTDTTMQVSVCPEIHEVQPQCVQAGKYVTLYGKNLSQIEGVYLTGEGLELETFEPFCFSESLSASCPAFEAYQVPEYQVLDFDNITFQIPEGLEPTELDVFVTHRSCGCVALSDERCGCEVELLKVI